MGCLNLISMPVKFLQCTQTIPGFFYRNLSHKAEAVRICTILVIRSQLGYRATSQALKRIIWRTHSLYCSSEEQLFRCVCGTHPCGSICIGSVKTNYGTLLLLFWSARAALPSLISNRERDSRFRRIDLSAKIHFESGDVWCELYPPS